MVNKDLLIKSNKFFYTHNVCWTKNRTMLSEFCKTLITYHAVVKVAATRDMVELAVTYINA